MKCHLISTTSTHSHFYRTDTVIISTLNGHRMLQEQRLGECLPGDHKGTRGALSSLSIKPVTSTLPSLRTWSCSRLPALPREALPGRGFRQDLAGTRKAVAHQRSSYLSRGCVRVPWACHLLPPRRCPLGTLPAHRSPLSCCLSLLSRREGMVPVGGFKLYHCL